MKPLPPSAIPVKTKAQRQAESAEAHKAYLARQADEYLRQRSLPTIEDKINALADAIEGLTQSTLRDPRWDRLVAEMRRVIDQETQA